MKKYAMNVTYEATSVERTIVTAKTKEEAIEKVKNGDVDDVIDVFTDNNKIVNIDIFSVREIDDD